MLETEQSVVSCEAVETSRRRSEVQLVCEVANGDGSDISGRAGRA
jgi:hypothetical protein